jgi:hypothetical protein
MGYYQEKTMIRLTSNGLLRNMSECSRREGAPLTFRRIAWLLMSLAAAFFACGLSCAQSAPDTPDLLEQAQLYDWAGDFNDAIRILRPLAETEAQAARQLGLMYLYGHGVPADPASAFKLLERASAEDSTAAFEAGALAYQGLGTQRSESTALKLWIRSMDYLGFDPRAEAALSASLLANNIGWNDEPTWYARQSDTSDVKERMRVRVYCDNPESARKAAIRLARLNVLFFPQSFRGNEPAGAIAEHFPVDEYTFVKLDQEPHCHQVKAGTQFRVTGKVWNTSEALMLGRVNLDVPTLYEIYLGGARRAWAMSDDWSIAGDVLLPPPHGQRRRLCQPAVAIQVAKDSAGLECFAYQGLNKCQSLAEPLRFTGRRLSFGTKKAQRCNSWEFPAEVQNDKGERFIAFTVD